VIRCFHPEDRGEVIALWETCGLLRPWNDPDKDIDRKLAQQPEGFLVMEEAGRIVGSVMTGYDGHRGWANYLAVHPDVRRRGLGRALMTAAEEYLLDAGCPKLNVQVRGDNEATIAFYEAIGYAVDDVVGLGKRLEPDD
jgi:ribosomal protein S18 acetylase RimI-like enzyme